MMMSCYQVWQVKGGLINLQCWALQQQDRHLPSYRFHRLKLFILISKFNRLILITLLIKLRITETTRVKYILLQADIVARQCISWGQLNFLESEQSILGLKIVIITQHYCLIQQHNHAQPSQAPHRQTQPPPPAISPPPQNHTGRQHPPSRLEVSPRGALGRRHPWAQVAHPAHHSPPPPQIPVRPRRAHRSCPTEQPLHSFRRAQRPRTKAHPPLQHAPEPAQLAATGLPAPGDPRPHKQAVAGVEQPAPQPGESVEGGAGGAADAGRSEWSGGAEGDGEEGRDEAGAADEGVVVSGDDQQKMSIYSGFATRQQEHAYDQLIVDLVSVLQKRVIKFYTGEEADEPKFHAILLNLHHHLAKMEESKYLQPKMALAFEDLLAVTAAASAQQPVPAHPDPTPLTTPVGRLPARPTRAYSSSSYGKHAHSRTYGKIKHQQPTQQPQNMSSRQDTTSNNPQQRTPLNDHPQPHHSKDNSRKKWNLFEPPPNPQDQQQRQIQYIIREYVSRGQQRRKYKGKRNPVI